ncbi:hypothetical protein KJ605_01400 [Patescibacteria group bacterium]|nr:hypothetical protein [Patescibacteria group bacterium]MBU1970411.1 hypothetical protein [Patescibacteria group bacterium]
MNHHSVVREIKALLVNQRIKYDLFEHEPVRTSEEAARIRPGYSLKQGAKALIVKLYMRGGGERYVLLVVPGDARFNSKKVKKLFDARDLRFATEEEVSEVTDGVLVGGVPPFGSLFGLETYVDSQVENNERIIFNAGDRRVSIAMSVADYMSTEKPGKCDLI